MVEQILIHLYSGLTLSKEDGKELPSIHVTIRMELESIMLNENNQSKKVTYTIIPFTWHSF